MKIKIKELYEQINKKINNKEKEFINKKLIIQLFNNYIDKINNLFKTYLKEKIEKDINKIIDETFEEEILKKKLNKFIFNKDNIKLYCYILNNFFLDEIIKDLIIKNNIKELRIYLKKEYNINFYKYENTYYIKDEYLLLNKYRLNDYENINEIEYYDGQLHLEYEKQYIINDIKKFLKKYYLFKIEKEIINSQEIELEIYKKYFEEKENVKLKYIYEYIIDNNIITKDIIKLIIKKYKNIYLFTKLIFNPIEDNILKLTEENKEEILYHINIIFNEKYNKNFYYSYMYYIINNFENIIDNNIELNKRNILDYTIRTIINIPYEEFIKLIINKEIEIYTYDKENKINNSFIYLYDKTNNYVIISGLALQKLNKYVKIEIIDNCL